MNTLIKNIETFVALVPTADGTEWAAIETYVEMAEVALIDSLWGEALHTALEALHDDDIYKHTAQKMLAFTAYHTAIPFVDLVATPSGRAMAGYLGLVAQRRGAATSGRFAGSRIARGGAGD